MSRFSITTEAVGENADRAKDVVPRTLGDDDLNSQGGSLRSIDQESSIRRFVRPLCDYYLVICTVLAAMRFAPLAFSPYAGDDAYLSHVYAVPGLDHVTLLHAYREIALHFGSQHQGFFPLAALPLSLWLIGLPIQKITQLLLVVGGVTLFSWVVRRLLGSPLASIIAVIATLCVWQFRTIHDPVLGTSLINPLIVDCCFLAVAAWLLYVEKQKLVFAYASIILLWAALLLGPMAWGGVMATFVLAASNRTVKGANLYCAVLAFTLLATLGLRGSWPWSHPGGYVTNAFRELTAALPMSFRGFGNLPIGHVPALYHNGTEYTDDRFIRIPAISTWGWLTAYAIAVLGYAAFKSLRQMDRASCVSATSWGIALWIAPALVLGPAEIWRQGLPAGQAFDGVYVEYFGVGLLCAILCLRIFSIGGIRRVIPVLAALTTFLITYGNVRADGFVLSHNARVDAPTARLQEIAKAGFFLHIPKAVQTIAVNPRAPFATGIHGAVSDARYAIYQYTGRAFEVVSAREIDKRNSSTWYLDLQPKATGIRAMLAHYSRGRAVFDAAYAFTTDSSVVSAMSGPLRGVIGRSRSLRVGKLLYAHRLCGAVPLSQMFVPSGPTLRWGEGFYAQGPPGYSKPQAQLTSWGAIATYPKMFMADHGVLTIYPSACPPTAINVTLQVVAAHKGRLTIVSPNHVDHIRTSTVLRTFTLRYVIDRRAPIRIHMFASSPPGDLDPVEFRYERAFPRHLRVVLEPATVSEDLTSKVAEVDSE